MACRAVCPGSIPSAANVCGSMSIQHATTRRPSTCFGGPARCACMPIRRNSRSMLANVTPINCRAPSCAAHSTTAASIGRTAHSALPGPPSSSVAANRDNSPDGGRLRQRHVFGDQVGEQRLQQIRARRRQQARTSAHVAAGVPREHVHGIVAIELVALEAFVRRRESPAELLDEHTAPVAPEIRRKFVWQPPFLVNEGPHGVPGSVLLYACITSRSTRGCNW